MAKKEVELDFTAFVTSIEKWDGVTPPFDEIVRSGLMHAALMCKGDEFRRRLSEKLEIGGSTISRYATGVAHPHNSVKTMVVRESHKLLVAMREQAIKEHNSMVLFMRNMGGNNDPDD